MKEQIVCQYVCRAVSDKQRLLDLCYHTAIVCNSHSLVWFRHQNYLIRVRKRFDLKYISYILKAGVGNIWKSS